MKLTEEQIKSLDGLYVGNSSRKQPDHISTLEEKLFFFERNPKEELPLEKCHMYIWLTDLASFVGTTPEKTLRAFYLKGVDLHPLDAKIYKKEYCGFEMVFQFVEVCDVLLDIQSEIKAGI